MESNEFNPGDFKYTIRYTIKRDQIVDFVNDLHNKQADYIEQAVEASGYKDAIAVIEHIKGLK